MKQGEYSWKNYYRYLWQHYYFFFYCGIKGYDVTYLPYGEKKITYNYGELQQLSEKHKQLLTQIRTTINSRENNFANIKMLSSIVSVISMFVGAAIWKDGNVISGSISCFLGVLGLFGIPMGLNCAMSSLQDQENAINSRIFVIDATKYKIDTNIVDGIISPADTANFYYSLFVDNHGFVYQIERGGACISHEIVRLETKYKFDGWM